MKMQDEDGDDSLNGALKDKESNGHGASISLTLSDLVHNQHLLVMCAKHPPVDYKPDTDDMAGEGHQGGTSQAVKLMVQQKGSMKLKCISKKGQAFWCRKLTSSECEGALTGKCTIKIMQDDKLYIIN